jgi:hypothetical protein
MVTYDKHNKYITKYIILTILFPHPENSRLIIDR